VFKRLEFNSDRKRMSILLYDRQDGQYKLYIKGADNVIFERLDKNNNMPEMIHETQVFLKKASSKGFRTLLVGIKVFD
jgi:magnesium-transporting ATPase (P-type)